MVITRTPHRISFLGGGTDYPLWYLENGGKTIGATIDKYCYITCRELPPFFEHKHKIIYSKIESVKDISEIQHPSVRETLRYLNIKKGIEIHHDGDIPARSGMGSSSAFTVGLLKALCAMEGRMLLKMDLAEKAIYIEQELIKENVGSQDQVFAAFGGLNSIEFLQNGEITVQPVIMDKEHFLSFENKFMLFFTGISRIASEIAKEQIENIPKREKELIRMQELTDEALEVLYSGKDDFKLFGELLNEGWRLKKMFSDKISNEYIDEMYELALKNGAVGGKLLGAGGGGFMLLYVEPENQDRVKRALKTFLHIPFKFDFTGSEIIFYKADDYYRVGR